MRNNVHFEAERAPSDSRGQNDHGGFAIGYELSEYRYIFYDCFRLNYLKREKNRIRLNAKGTMKQVHFI